jgi:tRNA-splicing ligase RtcB
MSELFRAIPSGVGTKGFVSVNRKEFEKVVTSGSAWCRENGFATEDDIDKTESRGRVDGADFKAVSDRATSRGIDQIGTLGSGNHYLEIEYVGEGDIYDPTIAKVFGIESPGQILVAVHCGSRGFGHQIATDYLKTFVQNASRHGLKLRDPELAAAPIHSGDGQAYFGAMACAANSAFANRQVIIASGRHSKKYSANRLITWDWRPSMTLPTISPDLKIIPLMEK